MALIDKEIVKLAWTKRFRSELTEDKDYYFWLCELQKWLREVHKIHIMLYPYKEDNDDLFWEYDIISKYDASSDELSFREISECEYKSHEEALDAGLLKALSLIK